MKNNYLIPLIGSLVVLLGLWFPTGYLVGRVEIWMWGFYKIDPDAVKYIGVLIRNFKFETTLFLAIGLGIVSFTIILICSFFLVILSIYMKKRKVSKLRWVKWRYYGSLIVLGMLAVYMCVLRFSIPGFDHGPGTAIILSGSIFSILPIFVRTRRRSFIINEFLTVKLRREESIIYIAKKPFIVCKHLIINVPVKELETIDSLDQTLERYGNEREDQFARNEHRIHPKDIFKGHCSNLQVWAESSYDTRLLSKDLAFPILKRLSEAGDQIAITVFKDEIRKRLQSFHAPVQKYLVAEGYLNYFFGPEKEELYEYIIDVDCWISIGDAYLRNPRTDKALYAYEHALEMDPINKKAIHRLCNFSPSEKALQYYQLYSELYGLEFKDYIDLGNIYLQQGKFDDSEKMYKHALQKATGKDKREVQLCLGELYIIRGKVPFGKKLFIKALINEPSDISGWIRLSRLLYMEEGPSSAISILKRGLRYNPFNIRLLIQLKENYKKRKSLLNYYLISGICSICKIKTLCKKQYWKLWKHNRVWF
jgi:tetratricopeptide (TPR) repeat protein